MPAHRRPSAPLPDVFVGSHAVADGLLSVRQLRGPYVHRVVQGVYRPAWIPLTHSLKCRALCLVLPDGAVVTGASAATVLGLALASPHDPVVVAAPDHLTVPRRNGVRLRRVAARSLAHRDVDGVRLAGPRRIAFDAAVGLPLHEATAALDAVVRHGIVDAEDLRRWLLDRHDNHVVAVRRAAALVDPRAESSPSRSRGCTWSRLGSPWCRSSALLSTRASSPVSTWPYLTTRSPSSTTAGGTRTAPSEPSTTTVSPRCEPPGGP